MNQAVELIKKSIQTDQEQELRIANLVELTKGLTDDEKRVCVETVHKTGGPCNHYFDLIDAIQNNQ